MTASGKRFAFVFALVLGLALLIPTVAVAAPTWQGKWGSTGTGNGQFDQPRGVASDGLRNIFVTDMQHDRVEVFSTTGEFIRTIGNSTSLDIPSAVDVDRFGNVFVASFGDNQVSVFTSAGTYVGSFGAAELSGPSGIAVDEEAKYVYVSSLYNDRVCKYKVDGTYQATWFGFSSPRGIDIDRAGNVYVCDSADNYVRKFSPAGAVLQTFTHAGVTGQHDVAVNHRGYVDVTSWATDRVYRFTAAGSFLTQYGAGTGTGNGQLQYPWGIAGAGRRIYVTDMNNDRVQYWQDDLAKFYTRFSGANRYEVAVAAARDKFGSSFSGVNFAVVVCGEDRAMCDALSAAGLAGVLNAPLFLTTSSTLQNSTRHALDDLRTTHGPGLTIFVLGGTGSVTPNTFNMIKTNNPGGTTVRIDGKDRYILSANIAKKVDEYGILFGKRPNAVMIFNAESEGAFYDALAAGAISAHKAMPMLAVRKSSISTAVKNALASNFPTGTTRRYVVSGTGWISASVYSQASAVGRLASSGDRYTAATQIAAFARSQTRGWLLYENVGLANKLPDSLCGGLYMGLSDGVLLYTSTSTFPTTTNNAVRAYRYASERGFVFGGTASISSGVGTSFYNALNAQ